MRTRLFLVLMVAMLWSGLGHVGAARSVPQGTQFTCPESFQVTGQLSGAPAGWEGEAPPSGGRFGRGMASMNSRAWTTSFASASVTLPFSGGGVLTCSYSGAYGPGLPVFGPVGLEKDTPPNCRVGPAWQMTSTTTATCQAGADQCAVACQEP